MADFLTHLLDEIVSCIFCGPPVDQPQGPHVEHPKKDVSGIPTDLALEGGHLTKKDAHS